MAGGIGLEPISLITPITTVFAHPEGTRLLALIQMLEASTTLNASSSVCCFTEKQSPRHCEMAIKTFHLLIVHHDELIIK